MIEQLTKLKKAGKLCAIFSNAEDTDSFMIGYIVDFDQEFLVLECLDRYGANAGFHCFMTEDIINISLNTKFSRRAETLVNYHKTERKFFPKGKESVFCDMINYILRNHCFCSIQFCDSGLNDMMGYIQDWQDGVITLQEIDEFGNWDGISYANEDDISSISCESLEEKTIEILAEINKPKDKIEK